MSEKEQARHRILSQIDRRELTMSAGARELGISVRQLRRSRRRYEKGGLAALVHQNRGKPSGRALNPILRKQIVRLLHERYPDFGPTFAAEKISLDIGKSISGEKIRQIQAEEGLHRPKKRKKGTYHPRRKRRSKEGELIQADGSIHNWLEDRGPSMTLITFIDDATSKVKLARFVPSETTAAYMQLMKVYVETYGRPMSLYVDKHSIFRQNNKEVRERGELTNLGTALDELGIELICANSPQAKGRVERGFGTLQDRLVKEMRLAGITSMEEANDFLTEFLDKHYNPRFSVHPASSEDAHREADSGIDLRLIFTKRATRKLSKNLTFQYENVLYQVNAPNEVNRLRNRLVEVRITLEGEMKVSTSWGKHLEFEVYEEFNRPVQRTLDVKDLERLWVDKRRKPGRYHPWR